MKKKKKVIIIVCIILFFVLCAILGYLYFKKTLINDIKSHYNVKVITNKKAMLYDKNNKKIGSVSKNFEFELENKKAFSKSDIYFKVKDEDYYLYYKDVKKVKDITIDELSINYLMIGKKIKTDKKTVLYKDNKEVLRINKSKEFDILYIDDNFNYVKYLNKILGIEEKDGIDTGFISIVNYPKIEKECADTKCVKEDAVKEELNYLKENGYYTITIDEYIKWHNNNLRLKEKAIVLTINEENEIVINLRKEYGVNIEIVDETTPLKFNDDNKTTKKDSNLESLSRYVVVEKTTIDKFKQITLGEDVTYEVPKSASKGQGIAVLNYHFFYDPDLGEYCDENICLGVKAFRQQLDYLKDNGFKTLTMEEFRAWMYGEIELPQKSVLITVDDGACGTGKHNGNKLIPLLEEYNMHATLFLISGWWDVENYRSPNLDIQSHTYDMHNTGKCGGAQVICATHDELLNDLQKSLEIVDNNNSFCFPFYSYDAKSIEVVKEAGFKLAFVGGFRKANRSDDKFMVPRYPIYKSTSIEQFINMVN